MNKKLFVVLAIVVALLVAGTAYVVGNRMAEQPGTEAAANQQSSATTTPGEPAPQPQTGTSAVQPGTYQDYAAAEVAATKDTKILFFHAQWCPQCRALEADIKTGPIPSGVTIFKVNYDTARELRQKYGVTLQTTLVKIDDQGNLVKKFVAYDEPTLAALVKNLL